VLEIDANHVAANQALVTLYISTGRRPEAAPYLTKLADILKDSPSRLALADLYIADQRTNDALTVLNVVAADPASFAAAKGRIASIEHANGQRQQAWATLTEGLQKEPNNGDLLVLKSRLLVGENKLAEALKTAQAAAKANPDLASAQYMTGLVFALQGNADGARAAFEEVLRLKPRSVPAQMALAQLHLQESRPSKTAELAREAIVTQPQNPAAHLVLAKALIADSHHDQAAAEIASLLQRYPNNAEVQTTAGALAFARRDFGSARRYFERALTLAPAAPEAFNGLVLVDLAEGQATQAQARITARLRERSTDARLWVLSARVAAANHDNASAERALLKAVELDSTSLEAYTTLARLYVEQRKLDQAKAELERVAAQKPNAVGPKTLIAMILEIQNRPAEARQLYENVMALDPRAPIAANNLAWMHVQNGDDLGEALKLARVATTTLSDTPQVTDTLGWVYFKMGLVEDAIPQFQQSVERSPNSPDFQYHLGLAHLQHGEWDKARQFLGRALQLDPRFPGAEDAKKALRSIAQ
jgi:tetratricopeptide (TPR) repeat protein